MATKGKLLRPQRFHKASTRSIRQVRLEKYVLHRGHLCIELTYNAFALNAASRSPRSFARQVLAERASGSIVRSHRDIPTQHLISRNCPCRGKQKKHPPRSVIVAPELNARFTRFDRLKRRYLKYPLGSRGRTFCEQAAQYSTRRFQAKHHLALRIQIPRLLFQQGSQSIPRAMPSIAFC
jgi:hypothetical protein